MLCSRISLEAPRFATLTRGDSGEGRQPGGVIPSPAFLPTSQKCVILSEALQMRSRRIFALSMLAIFCSARRSLDYARDDAKPGVSAIFNIILHFALCLLHSHPIPLPFDFYGKWADIYKIFMKKPQIPLAFFHLVC